MNRQKFSVCHLFIILYRDEAFRYHIARVSEDEASGADPERLTNEDLLIGIRPEFLDIKSEHGMDGEIYGVMPTGMETTVKVRVGAYLLTAVVFGSDIFKIGSPVKVNFASSRVMLFDRRSGQRIVNGKLVIK